LWQLTSYLREGYADVVYNPGVFVVT
jgi:hypothetical protein